MTLPSIVVVGWSCPFCGERWQVTASDNKPHRVVHETAMEELQEQSIFHLLNCEDRTP